MKTRIFWAIFLIATSIAVGIPSLGTAAFADKDDASKGTEVADPKVHENTGSTAEDPSAQDIRFHEGMCQGELTTEVLESIGGCDALSDPGESDDNRNDD